MLISIRYVKRTYSLSFKFIVKEQLKIFKVTEVNYFVSVHVNERELQARKLWQNLRSLRGITVNANVNVLLSQKETM